MRVGLSLTLKQFGVFVDSIPLFFKSPRRYLEKVSSESLGQNALRNGLYVAALVFLTFGLLAVKFKKIGQFSLLQIGGYGLLQFLVDLLALPGIYLAARLSGATRAAFVATNYIVFQRSITFALPAVMLLLFYVTEMYLLYFCAALLILAFLVYYIGAFPLAIAASPKLLRRPMTRRTKMMRILISLGLSALWYVVTTGLAGGLIYAGQRLSPDPRAWVEWSPLYDPIAEEVFTSLLPRYQNLLACSREILDITRAMHEALGSEGVTGSKGRPELLVEIRLRVASAKERTHALLQDDIASEPPHFQWTAKLSSAINTSSGHLAASLEQLDEYLRNNADRIIRIWTLFRELDRLVEEQEQTRRDLAAVVERAKVAIAAGTATTPQEAAEIRAKGDGLATKLKQVNAEGAATVSALKAEAGPNATPADKVRESLDQFPQAWSASAKAFDEASAASAMVDSYVRLANWLLTYVPFYIYRTDLPEGE